MIWYRAHQIGPKDFQCRILSNCEKYSISLNGSTPKLQINNIEDTDEAFYVLQTKSKSYASSVYSCRVIVTNRSTQIEAQGTTKAEFSKTINQVTVSPGKSAEFICEVEPVTVDVNWFRGSTKLQNSDKYQIISQGISS